MIMFFSRIYKSWEGIQEEKYRMIMQGFSPGLLSQAFNGRVLDVGAGSGFFERFLERRGANISNWVLVDPDMDMLKETGFEKVLGDGNKLPFRPESFDSIVCLDSIHLINEDFFWSLKKGGLALVSIFFNKDNFGEKREFLRHRLRDLEILQELSARGKEGEISILARKRQDV